MMSSINLFVQYIFVTQSYNKIISRMIKIIILILLYLLSLSVPKSVPCTICHSLISTLRKHTPKHPALQILQKLSYEYCVRKHLQSPKVCKGAIKQMSKYILSSVWRRYTNQHVVCQNLGMCRGEYVNRQLNQDVQNIIRDKTNKKWEQPTYRRKLRVMHISDLHPDLFYTPGSPVECTQPLCCRSNSTVKNNSTKKAGYWGSLGQCDVPIQTFDIFLNQLKQNKHNIDAIVWTGDNTPHDIWQQSQSYNLNFTIMLSEKIRQATNITVIPSMGNHESYPVNVYDFSNRTRQHVLDSGLAKAWESWLNPQAQALQSNKGFYKQTYPSLNNLKVLSINTQAGNNENWVLLSDPTDPGQMLKWMEEQLNQSERTGQAVYIIGHIPPKSNLNQWAMRYNALIDRYSYTVRGQLFGHTHADQFGFSLGMKNVNKDNVGNKDISGYYLVAPSMTTSTQRVPQYRILDIDYDTLQIIDYSQYRIDLRKYQEKETQPKYQLFYTFKQAWNITNMSPDQGISQLRNKLRDMPQMQKKYQYHRCAGLCQGTASKKVFCSTLGTKQYEDLCNNQKQSKKSKFQAIAGPWRTFIHKSF